MDFAFFAFRDTDFRFSKDGVPIFVDDFTNVAAVKIWISPRSVCSFLEAESDLGSQGWTRVPVGTSRC